MSSKSSQTTSSNAGMEWARTQGWDADQPSGGPEVCPLEIQPLSGHCLFFE